MIVHLLSRIFAKFQNNFNKILYFAKFLQCCFAATLCRSGGGGGGGVGSGGASLYRPSAPSPPMQIVPNSAFRYTFFHSVIFNSVVCSHFVSVKTQCLTAIGGHVT